MATKKLHEHCDFLKFLRVPYYIASYDNCPKANRISIIDVKEIAK